MQVVVQSMSYHYHFEYNIKWLPKLSKKLREEVQYNLQTDQLVKIDVQILPCSDIDKNTWEKKLGNFALKHYNILTKPGIKIG